MSAQSPHRNLTYRRTQHQNHSFSLVFLYHFNQIDHLTIIASAKDLHKTHAVATSSHQRWISTKPPGKIAIAIHSLITNREKKNRLPLQRKSIKIPQRKVDCVYLISVVIHFDSNFFSFFHFLILLAHFFRFIDLWTK